MRSVFKKLYARLPEPIRYSIVRRFIEVPDQLPDEIEFKIATTQEELESAFRLLHSAYVAQKYMQPHPSGMRVTKYHALPTTTTLIAKFKGQVIGTLSIIRDTPMGLPLDAAFDLSGLRGRYRQIAEVSSLAIHKDFRVHHGAFLWPLLKYFYRYSREFMKLDAIIIGVNPLWADFYLGIMLFRKIHAHTVDKYDFANGNPVTGFYLDLAKAPLEYSMVYSHFPKKRNLLEYFSAALETNFSMPDRRFHRISDPVMTPELMSYFFFEKSEVFQRLSQSEIETLRLAYPDKKYQLVFANLEKPIHPVRRQELRYQVNCRALFSEGGQHQIVIVTDVSRHGIRILGSFDQPVLRLMVQVSDTHNAEITVRPVSKAPNGETGMIITRASSAYNRFIDYLEQSYEIHAIQNSNQKTS